MSGLFDRADLLDGLNPRQKEAAGIIDGPALVLAGAGSGKTRVLTHRIAWLINRGVKPWQILAMTFTNKAAAEMRERVQTLLAEHGRAEAAREVWLSTFHSTCVRFLRRDIEHLGYSRGFTIYDADDQKRLLKTILGELGVSPDKLSPNELRSRIDQAKNKLLSVDAYAAEARLAAGDRTVDAWRAYERSLKAANAVDFNDLIGMVVRLWTEHPRVLQRYRQRYRYLLVDEYQDTNRAQFELVRLLSGDVEGMPPHRNVMVVGDDDQSIYGFRGADIRNIHDFEATFPGARVVRLEQNYRSTKNILTAANAVVKNNRGRMSKELWTEAPDGAKIRVEVTEDEHAEARFVVGHITKAVRGGRRYGDFAVIYRTNAASRAFEQALTRARVPHVLVGARKFYERREIRDVVAYLKLLLNPADDMAFQRVVNVPRRGVGAKTLEGFRTIAEQNGVPLLEAAKLWAGTGKTKARAAVRSFVALLDALRERVADHEPGELVHMLVKESGYDEWLRQDDQREAADRLANVRELASALAEEDDEAVDPDASDDPWLASAPGEGEAGAGPDDPWGRLQAFLDKASLSGQSDELPDEGVGRVTLLTAHLAKGLEFPVVFVVGMNEGHFPHSRSRESEHELEEERRLVYVAFTRAEQELILTRPRRRALFGGPPQDQSRSRFLSEVPSEVLELRGDGVRSRRSPLSRDDRARRLGFGGRPERSVHRGGLRNMTVPPAPAPAPVPSGEYRTAQVESPAQLSRGARVLHPKFGPGTVRKAEGSPQNLKLVVVFDGAGRKTIYARFAQLELLL